MFWKCILGQKLRTKPLLNSDVDLLSYFWSNLFLRSMPSLFGHTNCILAIRSIFLGTWDYFQMKKINFNAQIKVFLFFFVFFCFVFYGGGQALIFSTDELVGVGHFFAWQGYLSLLAVDNEIIITSVRGLCMAEFFKHQCNINTGQHEPWQIWQFLNSINIIQIYLNIHLRP